MTQAVKDERRRKVAQLSTLRRADRILEDCHYTTSARASLVTRIVELEFEIKQLGRAGSYRSKGVS